jgi:hypothetical protein
VVDGPDTISGSFTLASGDWSTVANLNVQATLPYAGSNSYAQLVTLIDDLAFNGASFVPNATNSDARYLYLVNTSQPAASYHIALGIRLQNLSQQIITTYNIGAWGSGHPTEVEDLTLLWDYFQGSVADPVTSAPIVAGVPEPSTWAMMLIGFAGLGFTFRQSRCKVSLVSATQPLRGSERPPFVPLLLVPRVCRFDLDGGHGSDDGTRCRSLKHQSFRVIYRSNKKSHGGAMGLLIRCRSV